MKIEIKFKVQWDQIDSILVELQQLEGVEKVECIEKKFLENDILSRRPNNQIEILEVVINIVLAIASEEAYKYVKDRIGDYFSNRKINPESNNSKPKKKKTKK
jgi:hypothetical protein